METRTFIRKSFEVEAVQVTAENMVEVAEWCRGRVVKAKADEEQHVKVRVMRVMDERQTKAFVGDWVLYAGTGYKVYNAKAFVKSFEPVGEELRTVDEPAPAATS